MTCLFVFCLNGKIYRGKSKKIEKLRFLKYAIIKKIKQEVYHDKIIWKLGSGR